MPAPPPTSARKAGAGYDTAAIEALAGLDPCHSDVATKRAALTVGIPIIINALGAGV